mmetsp:Transcript_16349/g.29150  ORF Transcript_16349/g.29150 Transcript_16349/m.29150 type:complete len:261 (-) Transcript_16349:153-935(-)
MASVVKGVEAQEVGVEQGAKDVLALGEGAEDLRGGEGGVEEQPTADLVETAAEERREDEEVVVVDPNKIVFHAHELHQPVRKGFVGLHVRLPHVRVEAAGAEGGEGEVVVEQRPQLQLAKPFVVALLQLFPQKHRHAVELLHQDVLNALLIARVNLDRKAPQVEHNGVRRHALLCLCNESIVVPFKVPRRIVLAPLRPQRQLIGHNHHPFFAVLTGHVVKRGAADFRPSEAREGKRQRAALLQALPSVWDHADVPICERA